MFNNQKRTEMKSLKSIVVALCAAVVLMGCNMNNTTKGAAIGAGVGKSKYNRALKKAQEELEEEKLKTPGYLCRIRFPSDASFRRTGIIVRFAPEMERNTKIRNSQNTAPMTIPSIFPASP